MDIARSANKQIFDFVNERANRRLRPGTGYYSTPFRGNLLGESKSASVARQLRQRSVDVLWLGSNPCVPKSLEYILEGRRGSGHLPGFERQMASGLFGAVRWTAAGKAEPGWNPIEKPKGGWRVYRDSLDQLTRLDYIAMANFIPWGSQVTGAFLTQLGDTDRTLLARSLEFADDLNIKIVRALAPKLLVIPFSLGKNRNLHAAYPSGLCLREAQDVQHHRVPVEKGTFNIITAQCQRGRSVIPTAYLRHPSSLHFTTSDRKRIADGVVQILRRLKVASS